MGGSGIQWKVKVKQRQRKERKEEVVSSSNLKYLNSVASKK